MMDLTPSDLAEDSPQSRILQAAQDIIAASGVEAATTRQVALAAGVQAPTIYRFFGDKDGLLLAVAEKVLADYAAEKAARPRQDDPLAELRDGWDAHIAFAMAPPDIFRIIAARQLPSPALLQGAEVLRRKIEALAQAGRLRMPLARAMGMFHAAAHGVILLYLRQAPSQRDLAVSDQAREAILAAFTGSAEDQVASGAAGAATALRSRLPDIAGLSNGERLLLAELLDRIAGQEVKSTTQIA